MSSGGGAPPAPARGGRAVDLAVIGAGVFGLWTAKRAVEAGLSVAVIEARAVGAGASGGVLGALMPHAPDRWNAKKQFQLDALAALEPAARALEAETGRATGYGRVGRWAPIRTPGFHAQALRRAEGAARLWRAGGRAFRAAPEAPPAGAGAAWLDPEAAPLGVLADDLSARLDPRATLAALAAWLRPRARLIEGARVSGLSGRGLALEGGGPDAALGPAGAVALAAGHEGFALAARWFGRPIGGGVKGQAAVFAPAAASASASADPQAARPLIYEDGVYVVPHADGRVAVGSTTVREWRGAPDAPDLDDVGFLERAQALCPALRGRAPDAWWAGVRPRSRWRDPLIGRAPEAAAPAGAPPIHLAMGGYKIGFGVAHRAAEALVAEMIGVDGPALPEAFRADLRLAEPPPAAGA
ncbi:MAG: FAD-dependent oxidoreductase [Pseudomonadota bacterium]